MPSVRLTSVLCVLFLTTLRSGVNGRAERERRYFCPPPCKECDHREGCKLCDDRFSLYRLSIGYGVCLGSCPIGYYDFQGICTECGLSDCLSCSDGYTCRRCKYPYKLYNSACHAECPPPLEPVRYRAYGMICRKPREETKDESTRRPSNVTE
ncbi:R-spondin-2-like [Ptychodera flava]|uniref:R-spondin-2-like n=1 Tax=Ptychodera flava TaxID=63121 RepID=UPI003969F8FA